MNNTTATDSRQTQALAGLTDRATTYGWTTVVADSSTGVLPVTFFRDLADGVRELLFIRLSAKGVITSAERNLGTDTRLDARDVFTHDKRTSVQLAMSA